jgi:hypothetical protein
MKSLRSAPHANPDTTARKLLALAKLPSSDSRIRRKTRRSRKPFYWEAGVMRPAFSSAY